eukprot:GEMP01010831.1.p1 GENE.GEMP01010831.1~~GEMP01010831.1.p1  ORF type:complete len:553 (+),score=73.49 GEMP01010831.1:340-1998(+)
MWHVNTSAVVNKNVGDVLAVVAEEMKWKEIRIAPKLPKSKTVHYVLQNLDFYDRFDLVYRSTDGWISRYPGMPDLCSKVVFAEILEAFIATLPESQKTLFDFWPTTWVLPEQSEDMKKWLIRKRTCIIKPEDGSQGDGIFLVMSPRDVDVKLGARSSSSKFVGQKYISNPLLIDGKKFDVRLYAICKSIGEHMEVFMCEEGLARFCTEQYQRPGGQNLHKMMAHLTNYSLNKRSLNFLHSEEEGSKRLWSQLLQSFDPAMQESITSQILSMVQTVMCVLQPGMHAAWNAHFPPDRFQRCPCFQILGFDVLIDDDGKCHLMEVNNGPSLSIDMVIPIVPKNPLTEQSSDLSEDTKSCLCMDHYMPHFHQRCPVDQHVKTMLMKGTFYALSEGGTPNNFIPVNLRDSPMFRIQQRVVDLFDRIGPVCQNRRDKGLGSMSLRRTFGTIAARQDIDLLGVRIKNQTKFKKNENSRSIAPCTLWVYELLSIVQYIAKLSCIPIEDVWSSLDVHTFCIPLRKCASLQAYHSPLLATKDILPRIRNVSPFIDVAVPTTV